MVESADSMKEFALTLRFCFAAVLIGFLVGMYDGCFDLLRQHHARHIEYVVGPAILLLAPLVDALAYGLLGAILGTIPVLFPQKFIGKTSFCSGLGLAIAGAHLIYRPAAAWIHIGRLPSIVDGGVALVSGSLLAVAAIRYWPMVWPRDVAPNNQFRHPRRSLPWYGAVLAGGVIVISVIAWTAVTVTKPRTPKRSIGVAANSPNIVMIALDTARADHFSSYGYAKPTTPNLDSLAAHGVLFETAIAAAPWTLPSFAAVFTGLLPHQNQTNWETPLPSGCATLASILRSRGYQTAGFNANYTTATVRTGLAQGFDVYNDEDGSLRTDFASIGLMRAFWWLVYYPLIRGDLLQRRDARALNQTVFRWFDQRTEQPFFVFVNYFDAHEPYNAIPEIGNRFGNARTTVAQRIRAEVDGLTTEIEVPRSPAEQAALIADYDSGLAFADTQIAKLLQRLTSAPQWSNTYLIVFGDHGQAFGTHRNYGHGWGLNWELLHVPLIISGPGIPQGRRVKDLVGLQQLFATVLDLSEEHGPAPGPSSLACFWTRSNGACDSAQMVISELVGGDPTLEKNGSSISAITPDRHFIRDAGGDLQLYDVNTDRLELENLAGSPHHQTELVALQRQLFDHIQNSSSPWRGEEYLWALGERGFSLLADKHMVHTKWPTLKLKQPSTQENELLHSIPY